MQEVTQAIVKSLSGFGLWRLVLIGAMLSTSAISRTNAEDVSSDTQRITIEEVYNVFKLPPEAVQTNITRWMGLGEFYDIFQEDAAKLFLRKLPDVASRSTLSNVLNRIPSFYRGVPTIWMRATDSDCAENTMRMIASTRLECENITNALSKLHVIYTNGDESLRIRRVQTGFLLNEMVALMIERGIDVPREFRWCPEYVRRAVYESAKDFSAKEMFERSIKGLIVRRFEMKQYVTDHERWQSLEDAKQSLVSNYAYQCLLLRESEKLAQYGKALITDAKEGGSDRREKWTTEQLFWAYIVAARHLPQEDAKLLLKKMQTLLGDELIKSFHWQKKYKEAMVFSDELWWFKCLYYGNEMPYSIYRQVEPQRDK